MIVLLGASLLGFAVVFAKWGLIGGRTKRDPGHCLNARVAGLPASFDESRGLLNADYDALARGRQSGCGAG